MSVWQFKFSLVPAKGIERVHGEMVSELAEFKLSNGEMLDEPEYPNYWEGNGIGPEIIARVEAMLPRMESWSDEAVMYGTDEGDKIEIWHDDFACRLDLRSLSCDNLYGMLDLARLLECKIVLNGSGEILEPDLMEMVQKIKNSNAYAFCMSPEDYLRGLSKKNKKTG